MRVDHHEESRQVTPADYRVYPFGRWLRRVSLDEFPQFITCAVGPDERRWAAPAHPSA